MTNNTVISPVYPMLIQKYNTLIPDPNANVLDKINTIIDYLNQTGKLTNDVVNQWNQVMAWTMNDGLTTDVSNKLETMLSTGEFDTLFQKYIAPSLGDITKLQTADKSSVVNAVNEVDQLAKTNQTNLGTLSNLVTGDKSNLVNAVNEVDNLGKNNQTNIGTLANLQTSDKGNLVAAINDNVASLAENAIQATNGSNDATKIQNAINSCGLNGVVKLNQGGSYSVSQTLNLQSNMTLDGNGATLTASATYFTLLKGYGTLLDSTLQALSADATMNATSITVASASGFSVGDDIYIFPNDGTADNSNNNNVEYNTITAINTNTLTLKNPLADAYTVAKQYSIKKCQFLQNVTVKNVNFVHADIATSTCLNMDLSFAKNIVFENCTFTNFYRNFINNCVNVKVKGCTISNCNGGISVSKSKRVKIQQNEVSGCSGTGIAITYFSDFALISENEIRNCNAYALFYNFWNDNGKIDKNNISNCSSYGICHDFDNYNSLISGNDISNCGNTLLALSSVNTNIGFHKVINNTFRDSQISGLTLEIVCNCLIENNVFKNLTKDNTISAITIDAVTADNQASYNIISKNIFDNISGYPIKTTNKHKTTTNKIIDNTATNCTTGISIYGLDNNYIIKNNKGFGSISMGTNNHVYDLVIQSPELVFSGSRQQTVTFIPKSDLFITNAYIIYTEATSADAGVTVMCGTPTTGNQFLNYFTTESSKTIGTITSLISDVGSQTIPSGSPIQFINVGGKTGTGKGVIFLECVFK